MLEAIKKSTFLITGGAGFIGSNIVNYLLRNNAKLVRVLDNLSTGSLDNLQGFLENDNFEFVEGDICDFSCCEEVVKGIDYISHQAALGSVPRSIADPVTSNASNISGHLNILTAAKNEGIVKRLVYAASSSTYGDSKVLPKVEGEEGKPLSPYAITKLVNELYAQNFSEVYGFHTIGLRYFNVFGPNQSPDNPYAAVIPLFMKAAINNEAGTIFGDGLTSRDFTFVDNAVQANIKALLNTPKLSKHEVVNIAFGERTTLIELWNYINQAMNKSLDVQFGPERVGDVKHSLASISKAKDLFGYDPKFNVKEGLKQTAEWFVSTYKV